MSPYRWDAATVAEILWQAATLPPSPAGRVGPLPAQGAAVILRDALHLLLDWLRVLRVPRAHGCTGHQCCRECA